MFASGSLTCEEALRSRRIRDRSAGAVACEAAIASSAFFLLMLVLLELFQLGHSLSALNYTVASAHRWAVTGEVLPSMSREESIQTVARQSGQKFGLDLGDSDILICRPGAANCDTASWTADDAGAPNEIISIQARTPVNFFFHSMQLELKAEAIGKNEPIF